MDSGFSPSTEVLYLRPRAHTRYRERRYLLWPAWMYRVVAPTVRPRRLNILEKAVLGLAAAGIRRAEAIGPRLHIAPSLAAYILVDLMERGMVSEQGVPTKRGDELLIDELTDAAEMTVGHVFQDPFTGELWPRFIRQLDYAEREFGSGEYPLLVLGQTGKPHRERPFLHFPPRSSSPSTPDPREILRASRRHRARLRHAAEMEFGPEDGDVDEFEAGEADSSVVQRISFVDEQPKPVFLTTYLYLTENRDDELLHGGWYVCDPFGLGPSPSLRSRIEHAMERSDKKLREEIERLIGQPLKDRQLEQRRFVEELRAAAELEVERRLTLGVRDWSGYKQLVEMESARQEVQLLGEHPPGYKLRALTVMTRQVLEESFRILSETLPLGDVWQRLYLPGLRGEQPLAESALIHAYYDRAAAKLGFESPIPERLSGVHPMQVRAVCQGDTWRLRPLIIATLLCAEGDEQRTHPLRRIAQTRPRLLIELDQLAEHGGAAAHATEDPSAERVYDTVDKTYQIVGLLAGLGA